MKLTLKLEMPSADKRQEPKVTKQELYDKVCEICDGSFHSNENSRDFFYILKLYRGLKGRNLQCQVLEDIKKKAAGYLSTRVTTASGDNFEEIDPNDIINSDGEYT